MNCLALFSGSRNRYSFGRFSKAFERNQPVQFSNMQCDGIGSSVRCNIERKTNRLQVTFATPGCCYSYHNSQCLRIPKKNVKLAIALNH